MKTCRPLPHQLFIMTQPLSRWEKSLQGKAEILFCVGTVGNSPLRDFPGRLFADWGVSLEGNSGKPTWSPGTGSIYIILARLLLV